MKFGGLCKLQTRGELLPCFLVWDYEPLRVGRRFVLFLLLMNVIGRVLKIYLFIARMFDNAERIFICFRPNCCALWHRPGIAESPINFRFRFLKRSWV